MTQSRKALATPCILSSHLNMHPHVTSRTTPPRDVERCVTSSGGEVRESSLINSYLPLPTGGMFGGGEPRPPDSGSGLGEGAWGHGSRPARISPLHTSVWTLCPYLQFACSCSCS